MFKVKNKDTRTTPLAYITSCSNVFIVNFEQVNAGWDRLDMLKETEVHSFFSI